MDDRISHILAQMAALEDDLRSAVHARESRMFFRINGKRVEFERSVEAAHRRLTKNFFRWLVTDRPQNLITGLLIDGMAIPLLMLDACVSDYLVFDRRHLGYLGRAGQDRLISCPAIGRST